MKKFFLLIAITLIAFVSNASTPQYLYMDFINTPNGYIYDGWTCWGCGKTPNSSAQQYGFTTSQPAYLILGVDDFAVAFSNSSFSEGGAADEWLVSPAFTIPVDNAMVSFEIFAFGNRRDSKYDVYISETGNTAADFEGLEPIYSGKLMGSNQYVESETVMFPINGYKDKTVYLAFVNKSTNAMLTGFSFINVGEYNAKLTNNTAKFVSEAGSYPVSMTLEIMTPVECAGFTAKMETSKGLVSEYVETKELSSRLNSYSFEFPDKLSVESPEVFTYTVTVTPNYEGATPIVEEYSFAYGSGFPRKVVMEEATGAWCGWCVMGHAAMEKYYDDYPENFIGIAVHNGDAMTVASYDTQIGKFISGYPNGVFNRLAAGAPYDESYIKNILKEGSSPLRVSIISADLNQETQKGFVKYAPEYGYDIEGANITAVAVVKENGCTGRGSQWRQANYLPQQGLTTEAAVLQYFGLTSDWWPYIQPYAEGSTYVNDMEYNDVAWGIFNDFYGSGVELPTSWTANTPQEFTISFDLPLGIQNIENTAVVVMLLDKATGEIIAAEEIHAADYENSSVDEIVNAVNYTAVQKGETIVVNAEPGAKVDIYSVDGIRLGSFEMTDNTYTIENPRFNGMLLVRITKGNDTKVVKLAWN